MRGELLVVGADSLWVAGPDSLQGVPLSRVALVRIQRHHWTAGRYAKWGVLMGAASGMVLTPACASVDQNTFGGCSLLIPLFAATGALFGGAAAMFNGHSAEVRFQPGQANWPRITGYARFPQGWPEGVVRDSVAASTAHPDSLPPR